MPFEILEIRDNRVAIQLDRIGPDVRAALREALAPLAARIGADARARAAAHIHLQGKKNPGSYFESIKDGVASKDARIVGFVRSGHPLAHLLEYGAHPPPHEILPDVASVLNFEGGAGEVFAKKVMHPGADIPAYPAIGPAFEDAAPEIRATLEQAVKSAVHK